jgi:ParB/RepB/Spo0J family partition protein
MPLCAAFTEEPTMNRDELAKMSQMVAAKFRGKAAAPQSPPPLSAEHAAEPQQGTLVEAPWQPPDAAASLVRVPEPTLAPETIQLLPLDLIVDSPYQPRAREGGKRDIEELAANIAANGQTTPIIVTRGTGAFEGKYHVHSGHRRCASMRLLGWTTVKAVVREDLGDREAQRLALMDNLGREDLSAFEQAMGFKSFAEKYSLDGQAAAKELGLSRRNAYRLQAIAKASPELLDLLRTGAVSVRAADSLARIDARSPRQALRVAKRYVDGGLSLETLEAEATDKGSSRARAVSRRLAEVRMSGANVHLSAKGPRRGITEAQRDELRAAVATFLWHTGVGTVEPIEPRGDAELPESTEPNAEAA